MKKIALNTLAQLIGKGVSVVLGIIITIILTRYLGPTGYGTYTFVLVFVTMFGVIGDWGLTLITIREASKDDHLAGQIIGNVLLIRLFLSVVAVVAAVVTINFLPYSSEIRSLVSIFSFFLIVTSLKTSLQIIFNVKLVMHNWAISEMISNFVYLGLIILIVYTRATLAWILFAAALDQIAAILVSGILGWKLLPLKFNFSLDHTRVLLWEALPMGGILVLFTVYNRIDTIILSFYKGQEAVGLYGAAYKIYEVLVVPAAYFSNSILPLISRLARDNREGLKQLYQKSLLILLTMGVGVAVANYFLAPLAIRLIAGPAFAGSVIALQILSLSLVVSFLNHINGYTIVALRKQWLSFLIAMIALITNVVLNLIFIPAFSYPAAAFITFLTEALIVLLSTAVIRKALWS